MFIRKNKIIIIILQAVDGATVMATKLVVEIGDAASRAVLSRVGYFIPLNAARLTGIRLVVAMKDQ